MSLLLLSTRRNTVALTLLPHFSVPRKCLSSFARSSLKTSIRDINTSSSQFGESTAFGSSDDDDDGGGRGGIDGGLWSMFRPRRNDRLLTEILSTRS